MKINNKEECVNMNMYRDICLLAGETADILPPFIAVADIFIQMLVVRCDDVCIDFGTLNGRPYAHFIA